MAYSTKAPLRDPSVAMNFVTESQQCAVDKELNSTIKTSAARELSKFLNSPELQQYFTLKLDVALKLWEKALNRGSAINFFSETDTLRLVYSVLHLLLFLYPLLC